MRCYFGAVKSVDSSMLALHTRGHEIGETIKVLRPAYYYSLAWMFGRVSQLAYLNPDEAFAEGYVIAMTKPSDSNGALLKRSVSRYLNADPSVLSKVEDGAPGLLNPSEEAVIPIV